MHFDFKIFSDQAKGREGEVAEISIRFHEMQTGVK